MHLLFPLAMALMILSPTLFPVVFNPDFAASAPVFNVYLLVTASRILLPASLVLAMGQPRVIYYVGLLELAVKIITGFVFIHFWGLPGVAWSVVVSYWIEKIGLIWYLETKQHIKTKNWLDLRTFTLYSVLLLVVWLLLQV
jgi:O-antigen/teichoic acid export membrane protein